MRKKKEKRKKEGIRKMNPLSGFYPPYMPYSEENVELYKRALDIYLKHAYEGDSDMQELRWTWVDHPLFFQFGAAENNVRCIQREVRFGCKGNPNMKMRVYDGGFVVDRNDGPDSKEDRERNQKIKETIERKWMQADIPVYGKYMKINVKGLTLKEMENRMKRLQAEFRELEFHYDGDEKMIIGR